MGRKPIGERAMSSTERVRRWRGEHRANREAAYLDAAMKIRALMGRPWTPEEARQIGELLHELVHRVRSHTLVSDPGPV